MCGADIELDERNKQITVWGTAKPQSDKDIVEAILVAAQKAGAQKEAEVAKIAALEVEQATLGRDKRRLGNENDIDLARAPAAGPPPPPPKPAPILATISA